MGEDRHKGECVCVYTGRSWSIQSDDESGRYRICTTINANGTSRQQQVVPTLCVASIRRNYCTVSLQSISSSSSIHIHCVLSAPTATRTKSEAKCFLFLSVGYFIGFDKYYKNREIGSSFRKLKKK